MKPKALLNLQPLFLAFLLCASFQSSTAQVDQQDSLALVAFYNALGGPDWFDTSGWLEGPVESWHGVSVDDNRVVQIVLTQNNLTGELPPEIGQLTALVTLRLSGNVIDGALPETMTNMTSLEHLILQANRFDGAIPAFLNEMPWLEVLDLYSGGFTGMVPDLGGLHSLREILLGKNDLTPSPFPQWMLELNEVTYINFTQMNLQGLIPGALFDSLPGLREFVVCTNNLDGDIGAWFKDTMPFTRFEICNNNFHGQIQDGFLNPEIGRLALQNNQLTGIPDFSTSTQVKAWFWVHDNKMGFHELAKALNVETTNNVTRKQLGPQKPLLAEEAYVVEPDTMITLSSGSSHPMDEYQWHLNGKAIEGAEDQQLTITVNEQNTGVYHCVIANSLFEFDLERSLVSVLLEGTTAAHHIEAVPVHIYPNPASEFVHIDSDVENVRVFDQSGQQVMQTNASRLNIAHLPSGLYLLQVKVSDGFRVARFVKD